jgi:hypothetical protein
MGVIIVKQFRVPSPKQEQVLIAFQNAGWPPCVSDPLPHVTIQPGNPRLHDTIKCLNAKQENRLIRFRGNGTGQGVLWEPIEQQIQRDFPAGQEMRRAA